MLNRDDIPDGKVSLEEMEKQLSEQEELLREKEETAGTGKGNTLDSSTIRVTPEMLQKDAAELDRHARNIKKTTESITAMVMKLSGPTWSGEAQSAYMTKFKALQDRITPIQDMIIKHAGNLTVISQQYSQTETASKEEAGKLPTDVFGEEV
ncbi:MAG: WXG100 family type VII secretion target [Lachnospiraceae bacterium]|nr:WXG100 family type VII secretion target [Lachnospiraceae bacterium]